METAHEPRLRTPTESGIPKTRKAKAAAHESDRADCALFLWATDPLLPRALEAGSANGGAPSVLPGLRANAGPVFLCRAPVNSVDGKVAGHAAGLAETLADSHANF